MKARRKSDGKIIEVETYMLNSRRGNDGSWESSYKDIKSGFVYEASELLFNLDYYTLIQGWLVRDKDGTLNLFYGSDKPIKRGQDEYWSVVAGAVFEYLPIEMFPDLTWDSEPEEVEIITKRKKK